MQADPGLVYQELMRTARVTGNLISLYKSKGKVLITMGMGRKWVLKCRSLGNFVSLGFHFRVKAT